ncbi:hypothetical protein N6H14_25865 [Paenibacillus sp. CC-CFT747]|nr:hypothetical protein N6H14_25865 [Paenibacillus sp. CC-CFT747]
MFKEEGTLTIEPSAGGTKVILGFPLLLSTPYTEGGDPHVERSARGR